MQSSMIGKIEHNEDGFVSITQIISYRLLTDTRIEQQL